MSSAQGTGRTVADQILDYLKLEDATQIFGVPGAGVAQLLHRLHVRSSEFNYMICRHETGAAYIADGYFRATGRPGVVLVTSGPGATNALTGTMNAHFDGSAVLTLTGEVSELYLGRGYLQEGTDCGLNVREIFAAATRYSADIVDPSSAAILIEQALRDMLSCPRRAVRIGIPDNVAAAPATRLISPRPPDKSSAYRSAPSEAANIDVRPALDMLSTAKHPLLMLGSGCREALRDAETARALRCLVEWWQVPVITTSDGKGLFPEQHALSLRAYGFAGCEWPQYWMLNDDGSPKHDALLVVGSSLGELATYRWNPMLKPSGSFMQVDLDQSVIGRGFPVTHGIVAEAGSFFRASWEQAPAWGRDESVVEARARAIAALKADHSPFVMPADYESDQAPLQPAALCRVLNELLPDDALVFIDCGNCVGWALHYLIIRGRQEFHSALAMGPMGFGVCAVIGARFGRPDRLAVALVGDGAFLMHAAEISTACAQKVGAIWVVLADDDLRMVAQGMEMFFPKDDSYDCSYRLGNPDLMMVATGLGAEVHEVNRPVDLRRAWSNVARGAEQGKPQVVVARVDRNAAPPYWCKPYWQSGVY